MVVKGSPVDAAEVFNQTHDGLLTMPCFHCAAEQRSDKASNVTRSCQQESRKPNRLVTLSRIDKLLQRRRARACKRISQARKQR